MSGRALLSLVALIASLAAGCRVEVGPPTGRQQSASDEPSGTVLIYSSMYRHVIDGVNEVLTTELPKVKVEWLQGGSEKIATRLDAELSAGAPRADLVMISDPLWYQRHKRAGDFAPHASIGALSMPRTLVDREGIFTTTRISTMVIAYNERLVERDQVPTRIADLFTERWRGKVTTPDPLGSGTTFTTLAFLVHHEGDEIIDRMKAAETISSGGNSSTLTRLESGEHQVGFVLLENVLKARTRKSPVGFVIPEEGAVLVPGPIALLAKSGNPVAARAVYDIIVGKSAQGKIVEGLMHSGRQDVAPPAGAPALEPLMKTRYQWSDAFVADVADRSAAIRKRFADVMGAAH